MNFIQKRIEQKKLEQEEQLKREYCCSMLVIEDYIDNIKDLITKIASNKKSISDFDMYHFIWYLEYLEEHYSDFLHDLKQEEFTSKRTWNKKIAESAKEQAEFMHKMKKQYRAEFERIYNNFKRISKGVNFPRRNEILGIMRKAFDFDSSKYYSNDDQFIIIQ